MRVKLRHIDDAMAVYLCDIPPGEEDIEKLIAFLKRSGGVYFSDMGETFKDICYQFAHDGDQVFIEIIVE